MLIPLQTCVFHANLTTDSTANWTVIPVFEFLGGVPEILVPDTLKSGVKRASFYDPDLNPTYRDLAAHYGVAVFPARPRKPKDKAKVEGGVLIVERLILARLRNQRFFSLAEANRAVAELLESLNQLGRAYRAAHPGGGARHAGRAQTSATKLPHLLWACCVWPKALATHG